MISHLSELVNKLNINQLKQRLTDTLTGLVDIDEDTENLESAELIMISGRPANGVGYLFFQNVIFEDV